MPWSARTQSKERMLEQVNLSSRPTLVRKARLRYEEVRKVDLLLLPERVVKLNATGAAILHLCDGKRTVREIARELETRYGRNGLEREVLEFLQKVSERGWIEFQPSVQRQKSSARRGGSFNGCGSLI